MLVNEMREPIFFCGINIRGKIHYLVFSVKNQNVEIPVSKKIADHMMAHLSKVVSTEPKQVERGNDEESL